MSRITSHVFDISKGKPAWGVAVLLFEQIAHDWFEIAKGATNNEGSLMNLLKDDDELAPGIYKIHFDIKQYFNADDIATFYPFIEIVFEINTTEHFHIPLMISPFSYSTYRQVKIDSRPHMT